MSKHIRNIRGRAARLACLVGCALLLVPASASAATADGYEPDNTAGTAKAITVDAVAQQHTISPVGDVDWFSFSVIAGRTYRITTASGTPAEDFDAVLDLYASDGIAELGGSDENWVSPAELIEYTADANKTVLVRVKGWDAENEAGTYAVRVELVGDLYEPDGTYGQATPITVGGAAQDHTIDPDYDVDWVSFPVSQGLTYRVRAGDGVTDALVEVDIYDTNGTTLLAGGYGGDDGWAYADYTATANKTVFARITEYYAEAGDPYQVSVSVISDDYEPDDTRATAKLITSNAAAQERNLTDGDTDWAYFSVVAGYKYTIEAIPGTPPHDADVDMMLYETNGTTEIEYAHGGGDTARIEYIADTNKTLCVEIEAWHEGDYSLRLTRVPIPRLGAASSVDFGTVALGSSLQKTVRLYNVGAAPLVIGSAYVSGAGFSVVSGNPSGVTIAPGEYRDVVLRYTPAVAYSGTPAAVQHDWSNLVAEWNYSGGGLASVSLYTGFQNTGGAGSLPWQVTIGSTNFTESGNVVAGGRYTMRIVTSPGPGTEVKVVKPIADSFRVMNTGSSVLSVSYIRVPDATLVIPSNDAVESTGTVGLLGTGSKPSVTLYNPVAPATMYRAKAKLVTGYLKPRHTAGTYPVRLYTYRYEGGKWVYRGYVNAKAYDYSTYTKYAAWVSLPYTGKWAIRAYAPEDSLHAATFSGYDYVTVLDVTVGNPIAPAAMYKGKVATVYGTLSPRHTAGTYPVRIYKWRYEGGAWKSYGYVNAKAYDYSTTYSRYARSMSLPYTGTWRLRAYHPADSLHAAKWSASYDTVTVK